MRPRSLALLAACIVICLLAGTAGSFFTAPAIPTWYATIAKPDFNPPSWVFAPVWTTLFILMGISLYLVASKGWAAKGVRPALLVFAVQFALNVAWSFLFFGLQSPALAFAEIILLWLSILATIILFARISRTAAALLVPYIVWVSFAAFLNYTIWMLNL